MRRIWVIAAVLVLAACVTVGQRFDLGRADELVVGESTEEDAKRLLGAPTAVTTLADSTYLLQWQYSRGTALGTGSGAHLVILFGPDGRMVRVVHQSTTKVRE